MRYFELFRTIVLAGALVLVSVAAEFFIPGPNAHLRRPGGSPSGNPARPAGGPAQDVTSRSPESSQEKGLLEQARLLDGQARASRMDASLPARGKEISGVLPAALPSGGGITDAFGDGALYLEELRAPHIIPVRNWDVPDVALEAKAVIVFDLTHEKTLFEKNADAALPLASITKLMTALVVRASFPLEQVVEVSQTAVRTEGSAGSLRVGEKLSVEKLLHFLLLPSSNDAAAAFAEAFPGGPDAFVAAMNGQAHRINLRSTHFENPSGLDGDGHRATARDLVSIAEMVWQDGVLMKILGTAAVDLHSEDGSFPHHLVSSNKLLGHVAGVVGGKTGYTEDAGQTMLTMVELPDQFKRRTSVGQPVRIVTVALGSPDRLGESRKLIEWLYEAYEW